MSSDNIQKLLNDPTFQETLAEIAGQKNIPLPKIEKEARGYLKELYTEHAPLADMVAIQMAEYVLGRGYETTIDTNDEEMRRLSRLMRKSSVAFVMTHKTYIDMFVLTVVLARYGLPIPYIFSGINMAFAGLGQLGRKVGSIFIRRSFKDNDVYKATLRHFIASVIGNRQHFMWAIEGTRSRTGKLVWPKMGILKYVAEAQTPKKPVAFIPVSIVYDLIPDVEQMTKEGRGAEKSAESLSWFLNYVRKMGQDMGRISIRFGEPVDMGEAADDPTVNLVRGTADSALPRFALELAYQINKITPVTTASLVCATLLSRYAATKAVLTRDIANLMALIESHKSDALVDREKSLGSSLQNALNLLLKAEIIQQQGRGAQAKYAIIPDNYLSAVYYSNMAVHHLVNRAFIELGVAKLAGDTSDDTQLAFWQEIMALRDLFKFEFFYSRRAIFSDEIESDLQLFHDNWNTGTVAPLRDQQILVAPALLSPYVEAYQVVAQALKGWVGDFDANECLRVCLSLGEEMHWQGRVRRREAVSKPFLLNGIRLAKHRNLIPDVNNNRHDELDRFIAELDAVSDRILQLQSLILEQQTERTVVPITREIVPGSKLDVIAKEVLQDEQGSHIGAFFDLDRTLIDGFSAQQFVQTRLLSGRATSQEIIAQLSGIIVYALGNRNFAALAATGTRGVSGIDERVFLEVGEEVYLKYLTKAIFPESRALVAAHLAQGHTVAIISAATPYQVEPVARDLGIEHVIATRMEVENGKFTGRLIEPPSWGEGKAYYARQLAEKHNLDLSKSYFYTDSAEDMALLEIVGKPRPLNPDTKLSAAAYQHNWPIYRFTDEDRPNILNIVRTGLLAGSMIPAALGGIATGTLNLSRTDGVNTMTALLGDLATRLAGIEVVVKGEENLWAERPAVFLFNHQSNADMFILSKILRKDVRAIAKKELLYSPVGPLFMIAGVIFIDRSNREKAIEAMKPAVEALQNGTSIAIAPEGTRSHDTTLGRFKKGAFHLAMNAKVPIVPIVIKDAHSILPRGSALVRSSAVEVRVLPPIDVTQWQASQLNERIDEVRNMFLQELGQMPIEEVIEVIEG